MRYLGGPASEERSSNAAQLLQTHRKCGEVNLNISDIDQTPHLQNKYTGNFYNQILCDIVIIYTKLCMPCQQQGYINGKNKMNNKNHTINKKLYKKF